MTEKLNEHVRGVYIIAATPFEDDGTLDLASTDRMVDFYLDSGVNGMTILGIMGEAPKLTPDEQQSFMKTGLRPNRRQDPGHRRRQQSRHQQPRGLRHQAMEAGAAGVMIAPLGGLKTEEQVINYFAETLRILGPDVPVVFQDYPQVTGVSRFGADAAPGVRRSPADRDARSTRKRPDCGSSARSARGPTGRPAISIWSATAGSLAAGTRRGADGAMTGFAYPEMLVEVCRRFFDGDAGGCGRPVRHLPAGGPARAAGRHRPCHPQGNPAPARRHRVGDGAGAGPKLNRDDHVELDSLMARLDARLRGG